MISANRPVMRYSYKASPRLRCKNRSRIACLRVQDDPIAPLGAHTVCSRAKKLSQKTFVTLMRRRKDMKKLLVFLLVLSFARITLAADYAEISGIRFSTGKGYVGSPVTITVDASGTDLYYKYWANTVDYCEGSPNWITLRDWTTSNSNTWIYSLVPFSR